MPSAGRSAKHFLQQRLGVLADAAFLLMHVGREEPEAALLELKLSRRLRDAALAQDQRLFALGKRLADDGPFLECVLEHGLSALLTVLRSRYAPGSPGVTHPG